MIEFIDDMHYLFRTKHIACTRKVDDDAWIGNGEKLNIS